MNARARLDAAYEEGQLGAEEYHTRSERAGTAETLAQLHRLVSDLQASPGTADLKLPQPDSATGKARRSGYPPHVRARDDDRAATCVLLDAALGDGQLSDDDHRALIELAGAAKTLGELTELTADLQRTSDAPAGPRPPRSHRRQWFAAILVAATVAAAVTGFAVVYRPAVDRPVPGNAELDSVAPRVIPTPSLVTRAGIALFRDNYRAKFGDTMADQVLLYPGYASIDRQSASRTTLYENWDYRGGFAKSGESLSRSSNTVAVDLATLDIDAMERLITMAVNDLGVENGRVSHIAFDFGHSSRARPSVSIYIENDFKEYANLEATPSGEILRQSPFRK